MDVRWGPGFEQGLEAVVNEGVRRGYLNPDNVLRASVLDDPIFARRNTKDNTPAVVHVELVPGSTVDVTVAAKGGGSENKSKMSYAQPQRRHRRLGAQDGAHHGRRLVPAGHAGHRRRRHRREGRAAGQAGADGRHRHVRAAAARPVRDKLEELRIELYEKVNALGIGAQGLGGLTTVLDVKIRTFPTHAASKPIAMIPNCAATRHAHFVLDGSGPAYLEPPSLDLWPDVKWAPDYNKSRKPSTSTR
jgi:fumarate hydratase class I